VQARGDVSAAGALSCCAGATDTISVLIPFYVRGRTVAFSGAASGARLAVLVVLLAAFYW
jgi:hypothetical protein